MSTVIHRGIATAGLATALVASVVTAPAAYAGGPNQVYVYGNTLSQCRTNLDYTVAKYRHYGLTVTGIHGCRKTGDGSRYFGDFVYN